jgi:propanol-preferring alcohol dehydrogenase
MKAMQLREPRPVDENPLELTDLPLPEPGPGQVRLRVQMCGVCHTDLHTVKGELDLPRLPIVPGHQVVATVDKIGPSPVHSVDPVSDTREAGGVRELRIGDRAGVGWVFSTCRGTLPPDDMCPYCRHGKENLCQRAQFTGLHADGGYAQYMVAPARFVYLLPEGFPDAQAAPLLCAGIIGYRSLRLSEIERGGRLGLYGFGASAHIAIQVARYWGCEVYVFTRSPDHQQHARELGAAWVGRAQDTPPRELDAAITFAPAGWLVPEVLRVLRKGGTLAINAIHMSPIPELPYHLLYGERTVRSVANFARQDAEELLALAAEIPIHTDVELYPLDAANAVLHRLKQRQVRGEAVLQIGGCP